MEAQRSKEALFFLRNKMIWFSLVELDLCLGLLMVIIYGLTNLRYQHLQLADVHFACQCYPLLAVAGLLFEACGEANDQIAALSLLSEHAFDVLLAAITVVVLRAFKNFESLLLMMMAYVQEPVLEKSYASQFVQRRQQLASEKRSET